ncbi:WD40 repeat domain-containing serine/threonine-protein kinase [Fimbriiglobus ruber]|uniref:High-affnity carbon uptake protein Hat/HatR n=1 Tax=Fimbriiglobus ruber TaxID=1908690 RepID=A0A225E8H0_9BACT|nr:protein kinase [Fimbriiglobus ruber]OWK47068.1 High-affnity carbon uptake protein Hat/HatR [Fimbriiglobus ruber]
MRSHESKVPAQTPVDPVSADPGSSCPDESILVLFLEGQGADQAALEVHIETCALCQDVLDRLTKADSAAAQSVVRLLRSQLVKSRLDYPQTATPLPPPAHFASILPIFKPTDPPPAIPGYDILGELGRGGMAVVYQARHRGLGRLVALKMLHAGPPGGHLSERLRQEARALARLHHPHIVHVYDSGEHLGRPFFSLEWVDGTTLARWTDGNPLPARTAAALVRTIAAAVGYAHTAGVLHRDLKPANVLLDHPPATPTEDAANAVKVSDFGLAKVIAHADTVAAPHTESGMLLGTPAYMAPEQADLSTDRVGPPTDVYALGAILFELLTGRPPFRADTPFQTLFLVVHHEPTPVTRLRPDCPTDLATITAKCLDKNPATRYLRADDLADDLARFLDGRPITARPIGPAARGLRWLRRRPVMAAVVTASVVVMIAAGILAAWQWWAAGAARERADQLTVSEKVARVTADDEKGTATRARRRAEQLAAEALLDQGLKSCEKGDVRRGLADLAQGLERVTAAGLDDLAPAFRANLTCWADRVHIPREAPPFPAVVRSVAFSPDGRRLLVGLAVDRNTNKPQPGFAQLWDPDKWEPAGPKLPHSAPVNAVAFNPAGTRIVTGADDGSVRLWDAATNRLIRSAVNELSLVRAVAFSPDGRTYAVAGNTGKPYRPGEVRIRDAETATLICPPIPHPGVLYAVAYSPDGRALVTGCHSLPEGGRAQVWEVATGKPVGPPMIHSARVSAVAFSPDGKLVLTASHDCTAQLWDRQTGKRVGGPMIHPYPVSAAAFTPDGKAVVTGGGDVRKHGSELDAIRVWDILTGKPLVGPFTHVSMIWSLAIRPDGQALVASDAAGRVRFWSMGRWRPVVEQSLSDPQYAIAYSPDGKWLAAGGGSHDKPRGRSQVLEAATGRPVGRPVEHTECVEAIAFAPDGRTYTTLTRGGTVRVWEAETGHPSGPQFVQPQISPALGDRPGGTTVMTFSPDGLHLLVSDMCGVCALWEWQSGRPVWDKSSSAGPNTVRASRFSPDGRTVLVGRENGMVQLCGSHDGTVQTEFRAGRGPIVAAVFSPDGSAVLAGGDDGTVRLWDIASGMPLGPVINHGADSVKDVGFVRNSSTVYSVSGPRAQVETAVQLWNPRTGELVGGRLPMSVYFRSVAAETRNHWLATGGFGGDVQLWDGPTGRPVGPTVWCGGPIHTIQFALDGRSIAAASKDGYIRVWNTPTVTDEPAQELVARVRALTERVPGQKKE